MVAAVEALEAVTTAAVTLGAGLSAPKCSATESPAATLQYSPHLHLTIPKGMISVPYTEFSCISGANST